MNRDYDNDLKCEADDCYYRRKRGGRWPDHQYTYEEHSGTQHVWCDMCAQGEVDALCTANDNWETPDHQCKKCNVWCLYDIDNTGGLCMSCDEDVCASKHYYEAMHAMARANAAYYNPRISAMCGGSADESEHLINDTEDGWYAQWYDSFVDESDEADAAFLRTKIGAVIDAVLVKMRADGAAARVAKLETVALLDAALADAPMRKRFATDLYNMLGRDRKRIRFDADESTPAAALAKVCTLLEGRLSE